MIRHLKTNDGCGIDDLAFVLRKSIQSLQSGDTLIFPEGEYHISDRFCEERICWISNHDSGIRRVFCNLSGKENVTIDGNGAKLIFHGRILPFFLENSKNIILKNFSVDYHRPFFTQGTVVENCDYGRLTIDIDPSVYPYRIENDHIIFEGDGWESSYIKWFIEVDPKTKNLVASREPDNYIGSKNIELYARMVGKTLVEFTGSMRRRHKVGSVLCITHEHRNYPGIVLSNCQNASVENVTIYHAGGMGILGQNCRDIRLRNDRVILPEGTDRMMSTNNDATHFVNCRGQLLLEGCIFSNQHDDGSNIHSAYSKIAPGSNSHTLFLQNGHFQQAGVATFAPGDVLVCVNPITMEESGGRFEVLSVENLNCENFQTQVKPLTEGEPVIGEVVENKSAAPELTIRNCQFLRNRGRGVLIDTSGKILIENNLFSTPCAAILHGYEAHFWYESGPVKNVVIQNNTFRHCDFVRGPGGNAIFFKPGCEKNYSCYPSRVEIVGNEFDSCGEKAVTARHMDTLVLKNNRMTGNMPEHSCVFCDCRYVDTDMESNETL